MPENSAKAPETDRECESAFDQAFEAGLKAGATSAMTAGVSYGVADSLGLNVQYDGAGAVLRDGAGKVQYASAFGQQYAAMSAFEKLGTSQFWTLAGSNALMSGALSAANGGNFGQGLAGSLVSSMGGTLNSAVGDWAQQNGVAGGDVSKILLQAGIGAAQAGAWHRDPLAGAIGGAMAEAISPLANQLDRASGNLLTSQLLTIGAAMGANALLNKNNPNDLTAAYLALQTDQFNRQLHPEEQSLARRLAAQSNGKFTEAQISDALRWANNNDLGESYVTNTIVNRNLDVALGCVLN